MTEHRDRRSEDRDIKELFETKLEVLDARYSNLKLQSEKVEAKIDKFTEAVDSRMRKLEAAYHGQENQKGLLVRMSEQESVAHSLNTAMFGDASGLSAGVQDDVAVMKDQRRKRDHQWALMGGLASGFAIWILTKFGDAAWKMLEAKVEPAPPVKVAPAPRRRVINRYVIHHVASPVREEEPEQTQTQNAPADTAPDTDQRPHAPLNPY